jgi:hypothetical protein
MATQASETVDLSSLDTQQLKEILKKKEMAEGTICQFKPTRSGQASCSDSATIFYGDVGFCKKHSRTVQAVASKKQWESTLPKEEPEVKEATKEVSAPKEVAKEHPVEEVKKEIKEEDIKKAPMKEPRETKEQTPKVVVTKRIKMNKWGRYEDPDTGILFNPTTRAAYGVQDRITGKFLPLTRGHIEICKKNKWKYHVAEEEESSESEEESVESSSEESVESSSEEESKDESAEEEASIESSEEEDSQDGTEEDSVESSEEDETEEDEISENSDVVDESEEEDEDDEEDNSEDDESEEEEESEESDRD